MVGIYGMYRGKAEKIDTTSTQREANYLAREYQLAFGREWVIFTAKKV